MMVRMGSLLGLCAAAWTVDTIVMRVQEAVGLGESVSAAVDDQKIGFTAINLK
jgi:hypothetical protein